MRHSKSLDLSCKAACQGAVNYLVLLKNQCFFYM